MAVRQATPWEQWPSGDSRPLAVIPFSLPDLTLRYGLTFEEGADDLDRYRFAAIALGNGQQAWLWKYENDPNPGTVVYADARADVAEAQSLLVAILGIGRNELLWSAPEPAGVR